MLFNSLSFLLFFPLTTAVYFLLPGRWRWAFLLACSIFFYRCFIPAYLWILLAVILLDYVAGLAIEASRGAARKAALAASLAGNVGVLAAFKYFNFFNANARALAEWLHWHYPVHDLGMLLPIGLSFHTFQSMAYTIEVYRGSYRAERHLGVYALYVMFYPQLVAGPIERPQNLLQQFREEHPFDGERAFDGLKQMLWGFVKKLVIADRLSAVVDAVYARPREFGGAWLVLATWFFAIQIYCDFSGYTDIAIGAARVLGYRLMTNFDRPYFSQSVGEFWRRWHISLSSWFRDYLYIPLGGSRAPLPRWCLNVMVVFLISGMWHGASWTFAAWGALHGLYLVGSRLTAGWRRRLAGAVGFDRFPVIAGAARVLMTFNLVAVAWVFFRAQTLRDAAWILGHLLHGPLLARPPLGIGALSLPPFTPADVGLGFLLIVFLAAAEWLQARAERAGRVRPAAADVRSVRLIDRAPVWLRWPAYYALVLAVLWIGALGGRTFIYFQF